MKIDLNITLVLTRTSLTMNSRTYLVIMQTYQLTLYNKMYLIRKISFPDHIGETFRHLSCTYLDINVANFVLSPDNGPTDHRWEYVSWEVASSISAFYKL